MYNNNIIPSVITTQENYDKITIKEPDTLYYCADTYNSYLKNTSEKDIVRTKCQCCNAPLNISKVKDDGTVRCEWCRAYNYVY